MLGGGRGAQAPLTSPCPPSNHTITINLTLTFAASWFGHASHVDWAKQDPPNFVHTPPTNTPNCPTWTPPPHRPSRSPSYTPPPFALPEPPPPSDAPPPPTPPPPPQGASGQQLVGGVVGVQNRGVAPPVGANCSLLCDTGMPSCILDHEDCCQKNDTQPNTCQDLPPCTKSRVP